MADLLTSVTELQSGMAALSQVAGRLAGTRPITSQDRRRLALEVENSVTELATACAGLAAWADGQHATSTTAAAEPPTRAAKPGDTEGALAGVAAAQGQLERARIGLQDAVDRARSEAASWRRIGEALGISGQSAHKRFDPQARRRHADRMRRRAHTQQ